jgi:hypothetical protein
LRLLQQVSMPVVLPRWLARLLALQQWRLCWMAGPLELLVLRLDSGLSLYRS